MASEAQSVEPALAECLLSDGEEGVEAVDLTLARQGRAVIAFVGMAFEAKIAAGPGVLVFSRNSRPELAMAAKNAARLGYRGMISFGVAGGLSSGLLAGHWVIASAIVDSQTSSATDAAWSTRLRDAIKGASYAPIVGVDAPVAEPATKRALHLATGAAAVDMESHVVARVAAAHGLAFTALRVIVDPADRAIPPAALLGMGAGAGTDGMAVLRDLIARPAQLPQLLRVSLDAYIARSEMLRVRRLLGPHFGLTDLSRAESAQPDFTASELARSGLVQAGLAQADAAPYRSPA